MATLLAFTAPPGTTDTTGGAALFANDFRSAETGEITGIWYYHTSSNEGANAGVSAHLVSDESLLASKSFSTSGLDDDAWNLITLDTPIPYGTPNVDIRLSAYYPTNMGFAYTDGLSNLTVGDLTVVRSTAWFDNSGSPALGDFPGTGDTTVGFAVGIEFEPDADADATIEPAVIAVIASLPAAAASGGATVTPSAIAAVTALPAETLSTGSTVSPAAIATTATLPAVVASGGATVNPAAITTTAALPASSASGGATVAPAAIEAVASLPALELSTGVTVAPAAIAAATTLPALELSTGSTVNPAAIAAVVSLPSPDVSAGAGTVHVRLGGQLVATTLRGAVRLNGSSMAIG